MKNFKKFSPKLLQSLFNSDHLKKPICVRSERLQRLCNSASPVHVALFLSTIVLRILWQFCVIRCIQIAIISWIFARTSLRLLCRVLLDRRDVVRFSKRNSAWSLVIFEIRFFTMSFILLLILIFALLLFTSCDFLIVDINYRILLIHSWNKYPSLRGRSVRKIVIFLQG